MIVPATCHIDNDWSFINNYLKNICYIWCFFWKYIKDGTYLYLQYLQRRKIIYNLIFLYWDKCTLVRNKLCNGLTWQKQPSLDIANDFKSINNTLIKLIKKYSDSKKFRTNAFFQRKLGNQPPLQLHAQGQITIIKI